MPCLVTLLNTHITSNRYNHECGKEEKNSSNSELTIAPTIDDSKSENNEKPRPNLGRVALDVGQILESNTISENKVLPNEINVEQRDMPITKIVSVVHNSDKMDDSMESLNEPDECDYNQKIDWILQILLRLYENPPLSDSLTDTNTVKAVVQYLCWTKYDSVTHRRAGSILLRVSKCIESIMPFLLQAFFPWLRLELDSRLQSCDINSCMECQTLSNLFTSVYQGFIFTAESGYIEGTVCHTLVAPGAADEPTRSVITVGIISLIMCKTLIFNILITHGGLEVLLQTLETQAIEIDNFRFSHAVLSLSLLAQRVDVVCPIDDKPLKLDKYQQNEDMIDDAASNIANQAASTSTICFYKRCKRDKNLALKFDDGSMILANKNTIVDASNVFAAMLVGRFSEATQNEVCLPNTSSSAMLRIVHYLYGCRRWAGKDGCCRYEPGLIRAPSTMLLPTNIASQYVDDIEMLLDLVPLSDKYLLTELNVLVSRMIVTLCTQNPEGQMNIAYKRSLNIICPTANNDKNKGSLNNSSAALNDPGNILHSSSALNVQLASFLLAGNIRHETRVQLFRELTKPTSGISSDFIDDISQIITSSLKVAMLKPKPIIIKQHSLRTNTR